MMRKIAPEIILTVVLSIATPQAPKQQKAALVAVAAFAAAVLLNAAPAQADVKTVVCASNPTSKVIFPSQSSAPIQ